MLTNWKREALRCPLGRAAVITRGEGRGELRYLFADVGPVECADVSTLSLPGVKPLNKWDFDVKESLPNGRLRPTQQLPPGKKLSEP